MRNDQLYTWRVKWEVLCYMAGTCLIFGYWGYSSDCERVNNTSLSRCALVPLWIYGYKVIDVIFWLKREHQLSDEGVRAGSGTMFHMFSTGLIVYFKRTTYLFICKDKYDRMCCVPCETLDSRLPVNDILAHFSFHRELQWILRQNQHMRLNKNITAIYHPPRQGLLWSHPISRWTNPWVWTHSGSHDLSQVPSEN